ncbi:MAG: hypothetical protein AAF437_04080 [Pseudomonadota bacterium]
MIRANKQRIKKRAIQALPDYERAKSSTADWSDGLRMVGGALQDLDGQMGTGNLDRAMTRTQRKLRLKDERKQAELDEKRRQAIIGSMQLTPNQRALMQLGGEDRAFLYGVSRDGVGDARDERNFGRRVLESDRTYDAGRSDRAEDVDYRNRRAKRSDFESDRNFGLSSNQFNHNQTMDYANLGLSRDRFALDEAEAAAKAAEEESPYSAAEIRAMRDKGEQLQGFRNSLNQYLNAIKEEGVQALDVGGRNKAAAKLDAMRQDLLFQGKNLWDLGVLSKDDYKQMERAIPDATGIGQWVGGKKVAIQKAQPLLDSIEYQLGRIPEEYRSYKPLEGTDPSNAPAIGTVENGYRFNGGNPADPNNWERV